jgi:hypothetical protein
VANSRERLLADMLLTTHAVRLISIVSGYWRIGRVLGEC